MSLWGLLLLGLVAGGSASAGDAPPGPPGFAPDTTGVVLAGQVRMPAYRGGPGLPGAVVEVRQGRHLRTEVTDDRGYYRIAGLAGGRALLQVRHLAAEPHEAELDLPARGSVEVSVELDRRTFVLPPVAVHVQRVQPLHPRPGPAFSTSEPRHSAVRLRVLESSPGLVESGLARRWSAGPPGDEESPPDRALFMRGSTVDNRMVLLDGAPILTPFHLAGLVSSFDARSLRDARVYLGGAPSRFEGGLSYVLDVESRPAGREDPPVELALDVLSLRGGVNLPFGDRGGIAATARGFHGAQAALAPSGTLPYSFGDVLVRGDANLGRGGDLRLSYFRNREGVTLDLDGSGEARAADRTTWGNQAFSGRWRGAIGRTGVELLGATARYDASLPVVWDDPVLASTTSDRHRAELEFVRSRGDGVVRWGGSVERQEVRYLLRTVGVRAMDAPATQRLEPGPTDLGGDRAGLFAEVERPLRDGVVFRGGGRVDRFTREQGVRVSPRVALQVDLTEEARLTLSGGRYHQYVPEPGLAEDIREGQASLLQWNAGLGVGSATHLVMELEQALSDDLSLGVSGFVKRFQESPERGGGRVNASGTDLRIGREGERLSGWVGYALSWFWEPSAGGAAAEFTGRHLLTTGARLRNPGGFEVGLSVEYGAGLPLTEVPVSGVTPSPEAHPLRGPTSRPTVSLLSESGADNPLDVAMADDFLRVDLEASWSTRPRLGGRETELRPYVRLLNALDRRDALFYYFDRWRGDELRPLAARPVLPLLGVEWRF